MKNAQNECENSAEKLLSVIQNTTSSTTTSIEQRQQQQQQQQPIGISTENVENVHNNNATAAAAAHATKMTDEHNNDNESSSGTTSINNNSNSIIIAEAAKILLKNGLNGTSVAAAALLTAASSFQIPPLPSATTTAVTAAAGTIITAVSTPSLSLAELGARNFIDTAVGVPLVDPPPAHGTHAPKVSPSIMSSAVTVGHSSQRNNGVPSSSPTNNKGTLSKNMNRASPGGANILEKTVAMVPEAGVIDYTHTIAANGTTRKSLPAPSINTVGSSSSMLSGGSYSGGRLQFFKDGKFILELARSKDGERGGWISVPRKHFRSPSATTSTVTPSSTANACVYPKIETSTSLSFSDDNSSIQSSPWQRDHCWKQLVPRRNISKEMSVYYKHPKGVALTVNGLELAKRKRRRPYDDTKINFVEIFKQKLFNQKDEANNKIKLKNLGTDNSNSTEKLSNGSSESNFVNEEKECGSSNKSIDEECNDGIVDEKFDEKSDETSKTALESSTLTVEKEEKPTKDSKKEDNTNLAVEKMNTSDGEEGVASISTIKHQQTTQNFLSEEAKSKLPLSDIVVDDGDEATPPIKSKTGVEDKRLIKKTRKVRAKLITIVQKLIDRMPARKAVPSKASLLNNSTSNTNFLSNKVSPTSSSSVSTSPSINSTLSATASASTSRLVDYHHHQQHVSPRKRILREFEKVSLEDNANNTAGAGGKRSRAKSCASAPMSVHYKNARSPNNRVHSSVCSVPSATCSTSASPSSNGENSKLTKNNNTNTNAATPTRLYSSYSIHSLLGDSSSASTSAKRLNVDQPALVSNVNYHQQHNFNAEHSFHIRKSMSPKSPEAGGGKSPSNSSSTKKRSPPYLSPMRESHSKSPTVSNSIDYSPRATPPEPRMSAKHRYGGISTDHQQSMLASSSPHHSVHHRHLQQGAFYSPYMMSPKYVPASSSSVVPAGATSPPTSRSPRHHSASAFTSCSTTSAITTATTQNIPNSFSSLSTSSSLSHHHQRELSPSRSLTAESLQRESTPRTVPKKTASIRRQFASPTATTSHRNNCASPAATTSERSVEDNHLIDNKLSTPATYQQLLQRTSPSGALPSPLQTAAYYMYPPSIPLAFSSNGSGSGTGSSSSNASSTHPTNTAAAVSASAYIPALMPPSYYHSYISALNITKHYYMGAGASALLPNQQGTPQTAAQSMAAATAARLTSSFHHLNIPYNGVNAAAMAAAAAAAAAFGGQHPMAHHAAMLPPPVATTAAALYGTGGLGLGLSTSSSTPTSAASSTTPPSSSSSHKLTDSNVNEASSLLNINNNSNNGNIGGVGAVLSAQSPATSISTRPAHHFPRILKDEHSSDVPLNLSKH